jgi:hypothetical protein
MRTGVRFGLASQTRFGMKARAPPLHIGIASLTTTESRVTHLFSIICGKLAAPPPKMVECSF